MVHRSKKLGIGHSLSKLSFYERDKLEQLFASRKNAISSKKSVVADSHEQAPATPMQIYKMRKCGDIYYIEDYRGNLRVAPDDIYIFVIVASKPGELIVSRYNEDYEGDQNKLIFGKQGHTSLSFKECVLYAGSIEIDFSGRIILWSNASGHYRPLESMRYSALLPHMKLLLPDEKFNSIFKEKAMLAGGYTAM